MLGTALAALRSGHWPSLIGASLHFEVSFMVWLLIGALGVPIAGEFGLTATQEGLLVGVPLLGGAALRIFTLDGQLVRQIDGEPGSGSLTWNGQNDAGNLVGSGIYFFVVEDETGTRVQGKFALVNRR